MRKLGVFLLRGLIVIVILGVVLAAAGGYYLRSYLPNTVAPKSFPQVDGEIQLESLDGTVDVYRDRMGIPHIYASTAHDLFFAQGYVHAQDRLAGRRDPIDVLHVGCSEQRAHVGIAKRDGDIVLDPSRSGARSRSDGGQTHCFRCLLCKAVFSKLI